MNEQQLIDQLKLLVKEAYIEGFKEMYAQANYRSHSPEKDWEYSDSKIELDKILLMKEE